MISYNILCKEYLIKPYCVYPSLDLEEKSETVEEVFEEIKLELAEVIPKNSVSSRFSSKLFVFKHAKKILSLFKRQRFFSHKKSGLFVK